MSIKIQRNVEMKMQHPNLFQPKNGNSSKHFTSREIEKWRKIKSIPRSPRGPRGISGTEVFLNLHGYYKKSQYIFFHFTQFSKILCEISNFLTYFDCPHWKSEKSPGSKLDKVMNSSKRADFSIFEVLELFGEDLKEPRSDKSIPRESGSEKRTSGNKEWGIPRAIPMYSSVPNRRACMFINFEKKFPPAWPYFGLHVY